VVNSDGQRLADFPQAAKNSCCVRNKIEVTVGRRARDGALAVGYNASSRSRSRSGAGGAQGHGRHGWSDVLSVVGCSNVALEMAAVCSAFDSFLASHYGAVDLAGAAGPALCSKAAVPWRRLTLRGSERTGDLMLLLQFVRGPCRLL